MLPAKTGLVFLYSVPLKAEIKKDVPVFFFFFMPCFLCSYVTPCFTKMYIYFIYVHSCRSHTDAYSSVTCDACVLHAMLTVMMLLIFIYMSFICMSRALLKQGAHSQWQSKSTLQLTDNQLLRLHVDRMVKCQHALGLVQNAKKKESFPCGSCDQEALRPLFK